MNRGINKETIEETKQKGKNTKANPIRVDLLVSRKMDGQINEVVQALLIEKAAVVRMLLWFALRFAQPSEIAGKQSYKADGQAVKRLDTRITQDMLDSIEKLTALEKRAKSSVIKMLLYWALANIGNYTIEDMLIK